MALNDPPLELSLQSFHERTYTYKKHLKSSN